jgi:hypothetical protein
MKRNMTLVRRILNWAIEQPDGCLAGNPDFGEDFTDETIGYHVYLMDQAGLVQAAGATTLGSSSPHGILLEVTWAGHDFADAAKDDQLWKKASTTILKEGASFSFELLKEWLKIEAKLKLGLC